MDGSSDTHTQQNILCSVQPYTVQSRVYRESQNTLLFFEQNIYLFVMYWYSILYSTV